MLCFSPDPNIAEQQMHAVILYLTAFGYVDGDFDASERSLVRGYIRELIEERIGGLMPEVAPETRDELADKYTKHFHEVLDATDRWVQELLAEPVQSDETQGGFVHAKLKQRCFEIFTGFDPQSRAELLQIGDLLTLADGTAHPAELDFRRELAALLKSPGEVELEGEEPRRVAVQVEAATATQSAGETHPFFEPFELHYSSNPKRITKQVAADQALVQRVLGVLEEQRAAGAGKLAGKRTVAELAGMGAFLDGHTQVLMSQPGRAYELTVLGDLHGCYSVLKAALMQSRFLDKVAAFRNDPTAVPEPRLVLLGDYIDRGLFSLNGVLRTVLQLFVAAPEHVTLLRGNHEIYLQRGGKILQGVRPAEAISSLRPYVAQELFEQYMALFEGMPNCLLFDRMLLVHGGIPRDRLVRQRWRDLSSLNDPDIRYQMRWSDPSTADVIPAQLQEQTTRFAFGRLQCRAFLDRLGCNILVRGHEKIDEGFRRVYDDGQILMVTVFSAGGQENDDLPKSSSYRSTQPMALTVLHDDGAVRLTPWAPDYRTYNYPQFNAFFRVPPEIPYLIE